MSFCAHGRGAKVVGVGRSHHVASKHGKSNVDGEAGG